MGRMSQEETKGFLQKKRSRREFFKISGKGIAGVAVGTSVLNVFGYDKASAATAYATPKGVLFAERERCVGCERCELMCTLHNAGKASSYLARIKVMRNYNWGSGDINSYSRYKNEGSFGNFKQNPDACRQCLVPACAEACPMKAIETVPGTGTRVVNTQKCVGCKRCTSACPWNLPTVDPETKKSSKCILCGRCAELCPAGAIKVVAWREVAKVLAQSVIDKNRMA